MGILTDLARSKTSLVAENVLLRQQLIVLERQVSKPNFQPLDRLILVILAGLVPNWRRPLHIVKPETLLKWHRTGFKLLWKFKSKPKARQPKIVAETILLIKKMASENRLWGAERHPQAGTRGELLKLNIRIAKRTIQKYMRQAKPSPSTSQNWSTFLRNHASQIWACDFLPVNDIFFRQLYAFVIMELGSRKIIHVGVTAHPTNEWTAQQLREATPYRQRPQYLLRDNDAKFGTHFKQVAEGAGIKILKTPIKAPNANANCERLMGTLRRELLDHFLIFNDRRLKLIMKEFVSYYNACRPHQGLGQVTPVKTVAPPKLDGKIVAFPVLGGLHHHYQRVFILAWLLAADTISSHHGQVWPQRTQQLLVLFVQAYHRVVRVIRLFVEFQHGFHCCYEMAVYFGNTPLLVLPGLYCTFFKSWRMVSGETLSVSSSSTALSANIRNVQCPCPLGTSEQAVAMMRASPGPLNFLALAACALALRARVKPSST